MFLITFRVSPQLEFNYPRYNLYLSERGYSELYHLLQRSPKRDGYGKTFGHRAVPKHKKMLGIRNVFANGVKLNLSFEVSKQIKILLPTKIFLKKF